MKGEREWSEGGEIGREGDTTEKRRYQQKQASTSDFVFISGLIWKVAYNEAY